MLREQDIQPIVRRVVDAVLTALPSNSPTQADVTPRQTIALGADHGGFSLKELLKSFLVELGYAIHDCGTHSTETVDYPDYAYAVAKLVSNGECQWGIIVDGAGIGSCMAANKVPGVRAALCYDLSSARNSREHNNANVLTLGGQLIGTGLARQIVETWLKTPFSGGRHQVRVDKIMEIERRFLNRPPPR
jgi:ribose 5-phosphate isomerase B